MTTSNKPPRDFDLPKVHLPPGHEHVLPKSDDPEVIAFRSAHAGLDRLRYQDVGLHIVRQLVFWPYEQQESRRYVASRAALPLFNTAAFAFREEKETVMRNRLKLPVLAEEAPEENWYETQEGLLAKVRDDFSIAEKTSKNWQHALVQGVERKQILSARAFGRAVGESALKLVALGLTDDTTSTVYMMQRNARDLSQQLLDQSREAHRDLGVDPSLKQLAAYPIADSFPHPPTQEVTDAIAQLQEERDALPLE